MTIEVVTFGCRLNAYESEVIRARATEAGASNTIIVNTCAVTGEAVRQSRQRLTPIEVPEPAGTSKAQIVRTTLEHTCRALPRGDFRVLEVYVGALRRAGGFPEAGG